MMKKCQNINLQEPQRNRNATAIFVNLIRTSTVSLASFLKGHQQTEKNQVKEPSDLVLLYLLKGKKVT